VGSASLYLENKLLDFLLGGGSYTPPSTVYVGLWNQALSDPSSGASPGEVSAAEYARVAVPNNATNWPASSSGTKANALAVVFPTAASEWGTVTTVAILDAATSGHVLFYATPAPVVSVSKYDTLIFKPGEISLRLD
jgi:hypothetical protein